jgi:1,4-alpha-glucan branching enzyme
MQNEQSATDDVTASAPQYSVLSTQYSPSALVFVLHGHLPYARRQGQWPHGEEWIHEAASTTYIPLLIALTDLAERGVPYHLTIGLTPILMEQLADPSVIANMEAYLADRLERAESDRIRFAQTGASREARVALLYAEHFGGALAAFQRRFNRDIVGSFAALHRSGHVELMVSAATHGYLPLLGRASSIAAQLQVGIEAYTRRVGSAPRSIWLPECAYRPAQGGLPGIESFLEAQGINLFFTESQNVEEAPLAGGAPGTPTTFRPYRIASSSVQVVARNQRVAEQVWSRWQGYPGDVDYREFHRKDAESGLWYWRITGGDVELGDKDLYDPDWAAAKIESHARHFVGVVEDEAARWRATTDQPAIICAAYDAELFGHWWFEGVQWLARVLELASSGGRADVTTATAGGDVAAHPADAAINLPPSSWGRYRTDYTWNNAKTAWMWPMIHERERRMESLVARFPEASGDMLATLTQAGRELLLLESSDWPFLVTTGQASEYATRRFNAHVKRFDRLTHLLDEGTAESSAGRHLRARLELLDNPFPDLDYHVFRDRGPGSAYLGPISPGAMPGMGATSGQSWGETPRVSGWGSDTSWHSGTTHSGHP